MHVASIDYYTQFICCSVPLMRHAMSIKSDVTAVLSTSHTIIAKLQCVTYSDQASPILIKPQHYDYLGVPHSRDIRQFAT